jgi:hypothetical protein
MINNLNSLTVEDIRRIRDDMYERHYNPDIMVMLNSIEKEVHQGAAKGLEIIEQFRKQKAETVDNS